MMRLVVTRSGLPRVQRDLVDAVGTPGIDHGSAERAVGRIADDGLGQREGLQFSHWMPLLP